MGKIRTDDFLGSARLCFQKLTRLKNHLQKTHHFPSLQLCMGMSQDWPVTVEEGADYVRIGTAIFGERLINL